MRPLVLFAVAVCLAGCGGAGLDVAFNVYEGDWAGDWTGGANGTADLDINSNGTISGTMHSDVTGDDGTVTGSIDNDGDVAMTVTFPGEAPEAGSGSFSFSDPDSIGGTVTFGAGDVDFDLDRQ